MTRRSGQAQDGFALVESIAVLALSALVLWSLLTASYLVTRNSAAAARRAGAVETLTTGLEALRRDVSRAKFARGGATAADPLLFQGAAQSLGLVIGADDPDLGESLVRIEALADGDTTALVRSSARLLPQMNGFAGVTFANPAVLMSGRWAYRFSYAELDSGPAQWNSSWTSTKNLPDAVRLEILDRAATRHILPAIIIPLQVNAETPCETVGCETGEEDEQSLEERRREWASGLEGDAADGSGDGQ